MLLVLMGLSLRAGGGGGGAGAGIPAGEQFGSPLAITFFIGNKRKIAPEECRSCSIPCLIIACTLQFEILVTDSLD